MEAIVTAICGMVLALGQAYLNFRLRQQDNARNAAREEAKQTAANVKSEAEEAAKEIERKVHIAAEVADNRLNEIHVLVNSRLSEALDRVGELEQKLGLARDEPVPSPPTITKQINP